MGAPNNIIRNTAQAASVDMRRIAAQLSILSLACRMNWALYTLGSHGWKHKTLEEHGPRAGGLADGGKDEVAFTRLVVMFVGSMASLTGPYG